MLRVINYFCVALVGLSVLALYHTAEKTRLARIDLHEVTQHIAQERTTMRVLQTEWERLASPARVQALAQAQLGMGDTSVVELSSFTQLPRRGAAAAPLNNTPVHDASARMPPPAAQPAVQTSDGL